MFCKNNINRKEYSLNLSIFYKIENAHFFWWRHWMEKLFCNYNRCQFHQHLNNMELFSINYMTITWASLHTRYIFGKHSFSIKLILICPTILINPAWKWAAAFCTCKKSSLKIDGKAALKRWWNWQQKREEESNSNLLPLWQKMWSISNYFTSHEVLIKRA